MKNTIFYLFFISLLVCHTGQARSIEMGHIAMASSIRHTDVPTALIQTASIGFRDDVFTYFDDYDEYDCDDHETVIKDKAFVTAPPILFSNTLTIPFVAIPYVCKDYAQVNFSRLPRFNYIALKVLRL